MANNQFVNKVNFGNQTVLDLTSDTVTPADVRSGVTFHDKTGESKVGSLLLNIKNGIYPYSETATSLSNRIYTISDVANNIDLLKDETKSYTLLFDLDNRDEKASYFKLFENCKSLKKVVICSLQNLFSKKSINANYMSFDGCSNLTDLICLGAGLYKAGGGALMGTKLEFLDLTYQTKTMNNRRVICLSSCYNVTTLKTVILASHNIYDTLGVIDETAFKGCTALETVIGLEHYSIIRQNAFNGCTSLDLTIPDTVTTIGERAFLNVPHITYHGTATGAPWGALSMN